MRAPLPRPVVTLLHALLAAAVAVAATALGLVEAAGFKRWEWTVVPLAALVATAATWLRRGHRISRALTAAVGVATLLLLVVAYTPLAGALARPLRRADAMPVRPADAIVVLSAAVDDAGHLSAPALDRLLHGADLLRRGVAPVIVLSRVRAADGRVTSDADQDRILALLGRPVRVVRVDSVRNTRDEATRIAAWAATAGVRHVALVTSPTHSRRACATFEAVGFRVTCLPSRARDLPLDHLDRPAYRTAAFGAWLYESLGSLEYRARGWVR